MPTYEELLKAGATPGAPAPPKGKGLTYEQLVAAGATPANSTPSDAPLRGMHPADAQDKVPTGPVFADRHGAPTTPANAPGTSAYEARHAGDEMNDPGAQALTGVAMAAPLAAAAGLGATAAGAGRLVPSIVGATGGAAESAMQGGNPVVGAALGAIPGAGGALRATDDAIGRAALNRAATAGEKHGLETFGRRAGTVAGIVGGGHHGGVVEALAGGHFASKAGAYAGRVGDRVLDRAAGPLADRYISRNIFPEVPLTSYAGPIRPALGPVWNSPVVDTDFVRSGAPFTPEAPAPVRGLLPERSPLAPLRSTAPSDLERLAPGFDEFTGHPLTRTGEGGFLPTDEVTGAAKPNTLRADVIRDTAKARGETMPAPGHAPVEDVLGAQLARSVRLLDELRAGKISVREAVAEGLPPKMAERAAGR